MGLKRPSLSPWLDQSHLRLWGPRWRHPSCRRLLRTRENSAASTLLQSRGRFHDSLLPGRLDAVLRQGSSRSNKWSNRVSIILHLNTRARPDRLCSVPIYEIWFQATGSGAAATTFMVSMTVAAFIASIGSVQTSSRLTWSFARDDAMILSSLIKRTNDELGVPVWALLFNAFWLFIIGCVYLASSSGESPPLMSSRRRQSAKASHSLSKAFNVFVGTAMLTELISFAFPAALLMWRRRDPKYLPKKSPFNLGKFGWLVNSIVIGWTVFALVIFSFPVAQPVTPGSMSKSIRNQQV